MKPTHRLIRLVDETVLVVQVDSQVIGTEIYQASLAECEVKIRSWCRQESDGSFIFESKNKPFVPLAYPKTREDALKESILYLPMPGEKCWPKTRGLFGLDDHPMRIRKIWLPQDEEQIYLYLEHYRSPFPMFSGDNDVLFWFEGAPA